MSHSRALGIVFLGAVALLFAACASHASGAGRAGRTASTAGTSQAAAAATTSATQPSSKASVDAALQGVVTRANQEQVQAFDQQNPRLMQDTATQGYYEQLLQTNNDLLANGVTGFQLVKLDWGPISVNGTQASLTTYETWSTSFVDGATNQSTDRNVYTLVQQSGSWKIQDDAHPDAAASQPSGSGAAPLPQIPPSSSGTGRGTGVPQPQNPSVPSSGTAPDGQGTSRNWSGYEADGGSYTSVTGTWTVPQANANSSSGADATWVGIGGVLSRDLIQAGTETTVTAGGFQQQAWVETLPQASQPVPLAVRAGDSVTVTIAQQSTSEWLVTLKNNTTGQSYHTTVQYDSSLSSVEWVEEAPSGARSVAPLDDFGTVSFADASAVRDGKTIDLSQAGAQPITMANAAGAPLAVPSAIGKDGKSFSISRTGNSSQVAGGGFGQSGRGRTPSFIP